jgi:hypothetical protein
MKRFIVSAAAVAALLVWPAIASAQTAHSGDSKKVDLHVSKVITVGTTAIKEGDYKVQCKLIGGEHFLVVTKADDGTEVARVPCTPEQLAGKVDMTDFRTVPGTDGTAKLTSVRIKGESEAHRIVNP